MSGNRWKLEGVPIVNAVKPLEVHITKGDVKKGRSKKPDKCAAALACIRQLHATEARIYLSRAYIKNNGKWIRYTTSPALRSEIVAFDKGGRFSPGVYVLYGMQPSKLARDSGSNLPSRKYKKRSTVYHTMANVRPRAITTG